MSTRSFTQANYSLPLLTIMCWLEYNGVALVELNQLLRPQKTTI